MTPADVAHWDRMYASQGWGLPWEEDSLAPALAKWWATLKRRDRVAARCRGICSHRVLDAS